MSQAYVRARERARCWGGKALEGAGVRTSSRAREVLGNGWTLSAWNRLRLGTLGDENPASKPTADTPPTTFFEVTKPITIPIPNLAPMENSQSSPTKTPLHISFLEILQNRARVDRNLEGLPFDRIFGVWLNDIEILRRCMAEQRPTDINLGIVNGEL
ncbi:Peptide-N4-(N-acetyl-beta-glucosaminyl)asparagineamidase A protein [Striga hermonthica]|uniref:Peptide-N4-(N-acetyl-beta-glucosaminyl)asparagine amidase A protein n=1 Tax=Striga hermonthica TaxID=68872 RepID=A0A9N7MWE4_STRHE|nr:Peptide-N4-(N-acetyl-beta-glucosaminyl)asparagineamidase A protein [Striga hermonthica]